MPGFGVSRAIEIECWQGYQSAAPGSLEDTGCNAPGFDAVRRGQLWSAMGLADRADIRNDARSERTAARPLPDMDIIENLVSAADPGGLAMYVIVMAVFLGSVALARLRDDAMNIHEAHGADDSEQPDGAG
jgi:hypothetical protein